MAEVLAIALGAILVNNFVLVKFLGICPFLGVSKKSESALGMGIAVTFVMVLASIFTYGLNQWVLVELQLEYLQTIVFILVIAALVQMVEMIIKKISPSLYKALGVYLPLITTNCAILGVALMNLTDAAVTNIFLAALNGLFSGLGFTLAIFLLSGLREKLDKLNVPKSLKGFPITMITASFMAMAFTVFSYIK